MKLSYLQAPFRDCASWRNRPPPMFLFPNDTHPGQPHHGQEQLEDYKVKAICSHTIKEKEQEMNENEITNAYFTELYSRNAAQKEKALENSRALHAADRNRTGTGITTHGILSPGRLPVPPLRQMHTPL